LGGAEARTILGVQGGVDALSTLALELHRLVRVDLVADDGRGDTLVERLWRLHQRRAQLLSLSVLFDEFIPGEAHRPHEGLAEAELVDDRRGWGRLLTTERGIGPLREAPREVFQHVTRIAEDLLLQVVPRLDLVNDVVALIAAAQHAVDRIGATLLVIG